MQTFLETMKNFLNIYCWWLSLFIYAVHLVFWEELMTPTSLQMLEFIVTQFSNPFPYIVSTDTYSDNNKFTWHNIKVLKNFHIKFHKPSSNGPLSITINLKLNTLEDLLLQEISGSYTSDADISKMCMATRPALLMVQVSWVQKWDGLLVARCSYQGAWNLSTGFKVIRGDLGRQMDKQV